MRGTRAQTHNPSREKVREARTHFRDMLCTIIKIAVGGATNATHCSVLMHQVHQPSNDKTIDCYKKKRERNIKRKRFDFFICWCRDLPREKSYYHIPRRFLGPSIWSWSLRTLKVRTLRSAKPCCELVSVCITSHLSASFFLYDYSPISQRVAAALEALTGIVLGAISLRAGGLYAFIKQGGRERGKNRTAELCFGRKSLLGPSRRTHTMKELRQSYIYI